MVLVSGSVECIAIYDLDTLTLRYNIHGHGDQINCIQLQVGVMVILHVLTGFFCVVVIHISL